MWKDVKDYEGLYQVSDDGRVRRIYDTKPPRILKGRPGLYPTVSLSKNCQKKSFNVHRLVAETYLDQPVETTEVNHKDGNKWNNDISNLEWVTQKENMDHAINVLKKRPFGKKPRRVRAYDKKTGEFVKEYPSISEAARELASSTTVGRVGITHCCAGRKKSAYGYTWEYVD